MAYTIEFTGAVIAELETHLKTPMSAKIYRRLHYLDLKRRGYSNQQIGNILQVSSTQMTNWSKRFLQEGFKGLCHLKYEGRRHSKLEPYRDQIRLYIQETPVPTLAGLQQWIKAQFNIDIEQSWLSRWIKKNFDAPIRRRA